MRWMIRIAGALLLGALVLVGALFLVPGDKIARVAAEQIQAQTGREVSIGGEVRFTLWPVLGVTTGPVRVANADWAGPEPMFAAESLSVGVSAPDLLTGTIRVTEIAAHRPDVRLRRAKDGRGNWEFGRQEAPVPGGSGAAPASSRTVTLERLVLTQARLEWIDGGAAPVTLSGLDATLDWPDPAGAASFALALAPAGERIGVEATIGAFRSFLDGEVAPLAARIAAPGGAISFDGRANTGGAAAGRLALKASDTVQMLAAAGLGRVDIPAGAGRAAEIATDATYTADGRLSLRNLALTLDQNHLSGAADLDLSGKPNFTAQLKAGALDVSTLAGPSAKGGTGGQAAGPEAWSEAPIDASAFSLVDGTLSLSADSLRTSVTEFGAVNLTIGIDRARAVVDIARLDAFGGRLTGQFVANNRKGFSVGGKLSASGIEMARALKDLAGVERFSGKTDAEIDFLGSGQSEAAIMRSLSGKGAVRMGQGVIAGIDLDALMKSGQGGGGTTVFDSLTASYTMTGGNLVNRDLALLLKNYRADGTGRIGIGARDIDYLFTPVALRARGGEGLAVPIRIEGPWAHPRIVPDLEGVLKAKADARLKELEEDAKARAKAKLSEKLGVPVETRAQAEEAVKDKVEDEVEKGLLKLLNKN